MKKRIHVAVGVVINSYDQVLIAKRPEHVHQGGLWEFPGGKVETGESVENALRREFLEEVAIEIQSAQSLLKIEHNYSDKDVLLDVYTVNQFKGEPRSCEGQEVIWVPRSDLTRYEFPEANQAIINHLL